MVRQEKKRIADLKRRNKVENELITHMDYDYKKMIRFHNQLKGVITGKCADGLYFNTSKINYRKTLSLAQPPPKRLRLE